jgi:hypothetical protein
VHITRIFTEVVDEAEEEEGGVAEGKHGATEEEEEGEEEEEVEKEVIMVDALTKKMRGLILILLTQPIS